LTYRKQFLILQNELSVIGDLEHSKGKDRRSRRQEGVGLAYSLLIQPRVTSLHKHSVKNLEVNDRPAKGCQSKIPSAQENVFQVRGSQSRSTLSAGMAHVCYTVMGTLSLPISPQLSCNDAFERHSGSSATLARSAQSKTFTPRFSLLICCLFVTFIGLQLERHFLQQPLPQIPCGI
jgi:hypothetical protein